jgi:hypothetical protein
VQGLDQRDVTSPTVPTDVPTYTVTSTLGTGTVWFKLTGNHAAPSYASRVDPLIRELTEVRIWLETYATFESFTKITHAKPVYDLTSSTELTVDETGRTTLTRASQPPLTGRLSGDQLLALQEAFTRAVVKELQNTNVTGTHHPSARMQHVGTTLGTEQFSFTLFGGEIDPDFERRLRPLVDALEAAERQLVSPNPVGPWTKVTLRLNRYQAPPFGPEGETELTLDANGKIRHQDFASGAPVPIEGQLTAAELRDVKRAFTRARVKTLPVSIVPTGAASEQVVLVSEVGSRTYRVAAALDQYANLQARMKPLVDALRRAQNRITLSSDEITIRGTVRVSGNTVTLTTWQPVTPAAAPEKVYTVLNQPFRSILRGLAGTFVHVGAKVGVNRGAQVVFIEGLSRQSPHLSVRQQASNNSPEIATIALAAPLKITGQTQNFYRVALSGNRTGYVRKTGVKFQHVMPLASPAPPPTPGLTGTIPVPGSP